MAPIGAVRVTGRPGQLRGLCGDFVLVWLSVSSKRSDQSFSPCRRATIALTAALAERCDIHAPIIREKCPPKNDVKPLAIRATRGNSGQILAKFLRDGTVQRVGFQWIADSAPFGTKSLQFSESATCPHRAPGTRDQGRSKRDRGPSTRQKNVV